MKKIIYLILILSIIFFSGCGDDIIDKDDGTTQEELTETTSKETTEIINETSETNYIEDNFAIYIIDEMKEEDFEKVNIQDIKLYNDPILSIEDIYFYSSDSNETIILNLTKEFNSEILYGDNKLVGKQFVFVLNGIKTYKGQVISPLSSTAPTNTDLIIYELDGTTKDTIHITSDKSKIINNILSIFDGQNRNEQSFILPYSYKEKIDLYAIYDMYNEELDYAINEIYARRGFVFTDKEYDDFFSKYAWYMPNETIQDKDLSDTEKFNIGVLKFSKEQRENYEQSEIFMNLEIIYEKFTENQIIYTDLNNDGNEDKIQYESYGENSESILKINNAIVKIPMISPNFDFIIVDIDNQDDFKEIVLNDYGPSSDNESYFFRYDAGQIINMGAVEGYYEYGLGAIGDGYIYSNTRSDILHTWFYKAQYEVIKNRIYQVVQDYYPTYHRVFLKDSLTAYKEMSLDSEMLLIDKYETGTLIGTDNQNWILIQMDLGVKAWIYLTGYDEIGVNKIRADEIFFGLIYAD